MGEAFITRRGGIGSEQALAPTITEVSTTETSITFTITNNDASTAVILYELDDATPDANSIELAAAATSSNIVVTGLADDTAFDVYATANVTGKVKSNVTELEITTDVSIVFTAATGGTTLEYDSGGKRFRSHTFTSNGNFVVNTVGDNVDDRNKVDYLIIAGGGAGGGDGQGGGGGAGGYHTTLGTSGADSAARDKVTVTATTFGVVIGAGGAIGEPLGSNGANSTALGLTLTGGGRGGRFSGSGSVGGSGGGGGAASPGEPQGLGGNGTANQGRKGGDGVVGNDRSGGGGGGAFAVGQNGSGNVGGNGGNGLANLLRTGSNETRAGGGAGGRRFGTTSASGGSGGGGGTTNAGQNGAVNTGSGGGGGILGNTNNSGAGGSGLVVIRYEIATV